jgi:hypothetical protein
MWQIISTSIIAAAGVFISWQQWRIAEIRLRHDIYERQFRVYEAAKTLLVVFQFNGKISQDDFFTYLRGTADADFIFDDADAIQYLQTLRTRAIELMRAQKQGAAAADQCAEIGGWLMQQFDVLKSKFRPVMGLHLPSTAERVRRWFTTRSAKA